MFSNSFVFAFAASLLSGVVLLRVKQQLEVIARARGDETAVQSSHVGNPLRVGGAAVLAGLAFAVALRMLNGEESFALLLLL